MPPRRKTPYVSTNITQAAKDELQRVTLTLSLETTRRLTQSAIVIAALKVAEQHKDEFLAALAAPAAPDEPEGEQP